MNPAGSRYLALSGRHCSKLSAAADRPVENINLSNESFFYTKRKETIMGDKGKKDQEKKQKQKSQKQAVITKKKKEKSEKNPHLGQ